MSNELKQRLSNLVRAEKLTLSGEIIIQKKAVELVTLQDVYDAGVKDDVAKLKRLCPALKIGFFAGVCDVTVKFFVYRKSFYPQNFYENMQDLLADALRKLEEANLYNVRLNVLGSIDGPSLSERFRYMNKHDAVYHKITDTSKRFDPFKNLRRMICNQLDRQ